MKRLFGLIIALTMLSQITVAQNDVNPKDIVQFERPLIMTISYGQRINTGGNENATWFGHQQKMRDAVDFRISYFLKKYFGIYGYVQYGTSHSDWNPPVGVELAEEDECGLPFDISITLGAGAISRFETGRWQFFGRIGIGATSLDPVNKKTSISEFNPTIEYLPYERWTADRFTCPCFINSGITLGYKLNKITSIVIDANYRFPIGKRSKVIIKHEIYGDFPGIISKNTYRSRSWGNDLTIAIGIQFQCELSK